VCSVSLGPNSVLGVLVALTLDFMDIFPPTHGFLAVVILATIDAVAGGSCIRVRAAEIGRMGPRALAATRRGIVF
jgi:hypothetical protein